jgi:hypothetical protein
LTRDGRLIYYNEPAEAILGRSFDDAGEMMVADLAELFRLMTRTGSPSLLINCPWDCHDATASAFWRIQFTALDGVRA